MIFDPKMTDAERKETFTKVRGWSNSLLINELRSLARATVPEAYGYLIVEALARIVENTKQRPVLDQLEEHLRAKSANIRSQKYKGEFDEGKLVLIEEIEDWVDKFKQKEGAV